MQKHSLEALARELSAKAAAAKGGRAAETVLGGHEKVLRQTVIAMVKDAITIKDVRQLSGDPAKGKPAPEKE